MVIRADSSVGIATRCGVDGPGSDFRWGRDFLHPSRPSLSLTQPPTQWVQGVSSGVKRLARGVNHPPPYSAEVKELYVRSILLFPLWTFMTCYRANFYLF